MFLIFYCLSRFCQGPPDSSQLLDKIKNNDPPPPLRSLIYSLAIGSENQYYDELCALLCRTHFCIQKAYQSFVPQFIFQKIKDFLFIFIIKVQKIISLARQRFVQIQLARYKLVFYANKFVNDSCSDLVCPKSL